MALQGHGQGQVTLFWSEKNARAVNAVTLVKRHGQ
jgi:hypothetical protein